MDDDDTGPSYYHVKTIVMRIVECGKEEGNQFTAGQGDGTAGKMAHTITCACAACEIRARLLPLLAPPAHAGKLKRKLHTLGRTLTGGCLDNQALTTTLAHSTTPHTLGPSVACCLRHKRWMCSSSPGPTAEAGVYAQGVSMASSSPGHEASTPLTRPSFRPAGCAVVTFHTHCNDRCRASATCKGRHTSNAGFAPALWRGLRTSGAT